MIEQNLVDLVYIVLISHRNMFLVEEVRDIRGAILRIVFPKFLLVRNTNECDIERKCGKKYFRIKWKQDLVTAHLYSRNMNRTTK